MSMARSITGALRSGDDLKMKIRQEEAKQDDFMEVSSQDLQDMSWDEDF